MINNSQELQVAIQMLERNRIVQEAELTDALKITLERLKPANMIRSALGNIGPANVVGGILKTAGSLGVGLLTSRVLAGGAAASVGRQLVGELLNRTAGEAVINNFDKVKAYGSAIVKNLFGTKKKQA